MQTDTQPAATEHAELINATRAMLDAIREPTADQVLIECERMHRGAPWTADLSKVYALGSTTHRHLDLSGAGARVGHAFASALRSTRIERPDKARPVVFIDTVRRLVVPVDEHTAYAIAKGRA